MISLSKFDIATRLRDYAHIRYEMISNPDITLNDAFIKWVAYLDGSKSKEELNNLYLTNDYLLSLYRTYLMYLTLKYFSLIEDNSIDFIAEEELKFDISKITSDKNISKKKLLLYLRNAFNHNDDPNHAKYNISPNGKYLEINLQDIRTPKEKLNINSKPKPFYLKINYNQLSEIVTSTINASRGLILQEWITPNEFNIETLNEEMLKQIRTKIYYLKTKINDDIKQIRNNSLSTGVQNIDEKNKILNSSAYLISEHYLYEEQINKILEELSNYQKKFPNFNIDKTYKSTLLRKLLEQTEPIPLYKTHVLQIQGMIHQFYMMEPTITQNFIDSQLTSILIDEEINDSNKEFESADNKRKETIKSIFCENITTKINLTINVLDKTTQLFYSYMMYYGYMLDTIIDDDYVEIDHTMYNRKKLRNSIVHGRYIISNNSIIHFYDRNNGYGKDNDFNEHYIIPFNKLSQFIENEYRKLVKNQISEKSKKKTY